MAQVRVQVPRLAPSGARLNSLRGTFAIRIGFSAAAAVLLLAGASLNVSGRTGEAAPPARAGGLPPLPPGPVDLRGEISAPPGRAPLPAPLPPPRLDLTEQ